MAALPALKYQQPTAAKTPRTTFAAWLKTLMRQRGFLTAHRNYDVDEFARRYGFAPSSVRHWLAGRRRPSIAMCHAIAEAVGPLVVEVVCAAGHLRFADIDDYNRAYHDTDAEEDAYVAMMTGDL